MKKKLALIALAAMATVSRADNPIVQTNYTADPAPTVVKDRLYVFTSHDEDVTVRNFFTMNDWKCYSTIDMVNWTDHGTPFGYTSFTWARGDAWAGQIMERDGKFYYYVPVNKKNGGNCIGVGVADKPEGPYKDAIGKPLIDSASGNIDPTPFIDNDGQAYLYWGNPALKYVKLNKDMVSYDQTIGNKGIVTVPLTEESFGKRTGDAKRATLYEEGPWLYKHNAIYYMVYAASGIPENICYATGPSAEGPWTFKGVIMPTEGGSFTNHPGVVDFKGKSYLFYHNGALPGGGGYKRSVGIEEFTLNADGTFPTIKMSKTGPKAIATLDPYKKQEAETICWSVGLKTKTAEATGVYVTEIHNGDYIKVANVDFASSGAGKFNASVASDKAGSGIEIRLDKQDGTLVGTLAVSNTGGMETWKTLSADINGAAGVHDVYFVFKGAASDATTKPASLFNYDNWQFEKK